MNIFFITQIIFALFSLTAALTINKYEIRDLESNTTYFQTEASLWTSTNTQTSTIATQCGGIWILGGYGVTKTGTTFSRFFSSLPPHNSIYFSFFAWYIDLRQQTNLFDIYIDNTLVQSINTNAYSTFNPLSDQCGGSTNDYTRMKVEGYLAHNVSTITIKFSSRFNSASSNIFSLGFRELDLLFSIKSNPTTSVCQLQPSYTSSGVACTCPFGQYDNAGAGLCSNCANTCRTCTGSSTSECTSCYYGASFDGSKCFNCASGCLQCNGTSSTSCIRCPSGSYLYWNGTCLTSCNSPLVTTSEGEFSNCSLPCGSDYYYQDGTCNSTCPSSAFTAVSYGDLKKCNFKCTASGDYLYANGSCYSGCVSPFTPVINGAERYCNFPCNSSTYYYGNGTCDTCLSPFSPVVKGVERYCAFPCSSPKYYYANGTCDVCNSPFTPVTKGTERYCEFPCSGTTYSYGNGTCDTCLSPFTPVTKGVERYCAFPCASGKYYYANGTCDVCTSPFTSVTKGTERYCQFACSGLDYSYGNGTCDVCNSPFNPVVKGVERYCAFPCTGSTPYLYEDGSCQAGCSSPMVKISRGVENYCNFPCDSSRYLYGNGSCYSDCPFPFTNTTSGTDNYCNFPCSGGQYYYEDGSCQTGCPSPYIPTNKGSLERYCNFPCASGKYLYADGTCDDCSSSPWTPVVNGTERYCNFPCSSPTGYLYEDGNCHSTCDFPLVADNRSSIESYCNFYCPSGQYYYQNVSCDVCNGPFTPVTTGTERYCNFPCNSPTGYLYEDGNCSPSCDPPFIAVNKSSTESYCNFPCASGKYYYENGTCDVCNSPFNPVTTTTERYCDFPCNSPEYYYGNNSCNSSCPDPFVKVVNGAERYCNFPCTSSEFLYSDRTCKSSCDASPYIKTMNGLDNYCNFPCRSSEFYLEDGSCNSTCSSPYKVVSAGRTGENYCNKPCAAGEYYSLNSGKCLASCKSPAKNDTVNGIETCYSAPEEPTTNKPIVNFVKEVSKGSSKVGNILRLTNFNSPFIAGLAKLLKYIQYLDVPIPPEIRDQMNPNVTTGFSFTRIFSFKMPEKMRSQFSQHDLPYYIKVAIVNSSYLVNQWQTLMTFMIMSIMAMIFFGLEKLIIKKKPHWTVTLNIMTRLRIIFKWNFLLLVFFNTYDDLTFFAVIELHTLHMDSAWAAYSFLLCLAMSGLAGFLLYKVWFISRESLQRKYKVIPIESPTSSTTSSQSSIKGNQPGLTFYKKWEDYQVLYAGVKPDAKLKQYYLFICTVRIVVCYFFAAVCYSIPVLQTSVYLIWSFVMLFLLIRYRPIVDRFMFFVNLTYEILILTANICILLLAAYTAADKLTTSLQYGLSETVLVCSFLVIFFSNVFALIFIIRKAFFAYKLLKKIKTINAKTIWLSLLATPFCSPGMDYDELTYTEGENLSDPLKNAPRRSRISLGPSHNKIVPFNVLPDGLSEYESDAATPAKNPLIMNPHRQFDDSLAQSSISFSKIKLSTNRRRFNNQESTLYAFNPNNNNEHDVESPNVSQLLGSITPKLRDSDLSINFGEDPGNRSEFPESFVSATNRRTLLLKTPSNFSSMQISRTPSSVSVDVEQENKDTTVVNLIDHPEGGGDSRLMSPIDKNPEDSEFASAVKSLLIAPKQDLSLTRSSLMFRNSMLRSGVTRHASRFAWNKGELSTSNLLNFTGMDTMVRQRSGSGQSFLGVSRDNSSEIPKSDNIKEEETES